MDRIDPSDFETQYISVTEAAKLKRVTPQAIYDAKNSGRIRFVSVLGRIGLDARDVEAYHPLPQKQHSRRAHSLIASGMDAE